MKLVDHARASMDGIADRKRRHVERVEQRLDRAHLVNQLGHARYASSKGVPTSATEIARIIREIKALDDPELTSATTS